MIIDICSEKKKRWNKNQGLGLSILNKVELILFFVNNFIQILINYIYASIMIQVI